MGTDSSIDIEMINSDGTFYSDFYDCSAGARPVIDIYLKPFVNTGLKIGDYVDYVPAPSSLSYTFESNYTGYSENQTVNAQNDMYWRVLNIYDNGNVDLISTKLTNTGIIFNGAQGYNNGVYLLNEMCNTLYSNSSLNATARSINIEDIQDKIENKTIIEDFNHYRIDSGDRIVDNVYYGQNYECDTYKKYPVQWENDNGANGESISRQLISGLSYDEKDNGLTVTQTYWDSTNNTIEFSKDIYNTLLLRKDNNERYYLASRYVNMGVDMDYFENNKNCATALFGLRTIQYSVVMGLDLYSSYSGDYDTSENGGYNILPVVSVNYKKIHKIANPE